METLKREKRDELKEWRKKVEDRDRVIADLMAQLGSHGAHGGPKTPLPRIDTKVSSSPGSSPVSAAGYLRSFNPFGRV